jgi:membrane-associated phospholipid phosphatase
MVNDPLLVLAEQAGGNALTIFLAMLFIVLILVTVGWRFFHGKFMSRVRKETPQAVYWICNVLGVILVIGGVFIFVEIAGGIALGSRLSTIDAMLTKSIKTHATGISLQIFSVVTHFGDRPILFVIGVIVTVLLWRIRRRLLAIGWAITLAGNAILNPMMKQLFERLRPLNEQGMANELGWSFPSGHASGATVTYGMLAYVALRTLHPVWHLPVMLVVISLVLTVGISRIFLQVHFASDVAAGFGSGLAWLSLCVMVIELIEHYHRIKKSSR